MICDPETVTYCVEHDIVVPNGRGDMWPGQKRLVALMARNAKATWQFLGLPSDRVVEFGSEVAL